MKFYRILALGLVCILVLSLFGCEKIDLSGGKGQSDKENDASSSADETVITVKTTVTGDQTFLPEGTTPKIERILHQIRETEERFGIRIDVEIVTEEGLQTAFLRAAKSGKHYADVIQTDAAFLTRYYHQGYFASLSDVGLEASATGSLKSPDGTAYALRADGWNNPLPTVSSILYYNEKLFTDANCETPLDLYEEGVWNWTNFEKLCRQVTQAYSGEVFALAHPNAQHPELVWASLHAAGVRFFDQNGTCIMDSREGLKGFSALQTLLTSGVTYRLASYDNAEADPTAKMAFTNRRTAMMIGNSSLLFETGEDSLSENLREDLRIISFPSMNSNGGFSYFSQTDVFCGITATANKELCRTVLPTLFAVDETSDPNGELAEEYFYHEDDAARYFDLLKSAETDTSLPMADQRSLVEGYFVQVANGQLSAKEYLHNLQENFNATKESREK
ncbi:MAG: extracellular solute-binding protein [Clostridia bacterium]|nr:extracellular solute-binding protein [Clostridia bacterium]